MRKDVIVPAAIGAVGAVAAGKRLNLVEGLAEKLGGAREHVEEEILEKAKERMESQGGLAGKLLSKALGGRGAGGGGGSGGKKTRRLPIQRWTDIAVPADAAYKAFTDFEEFPKFMHRVLRVEKAGRNKLRFEEKIWFRTRQWEAQITERRANDRIVWKTTSGMSHRGIVSFHKIEPNLTRVMVEMEFEPNGMTEKLASGLRFVKRAVQADLARFKAHVEMADAKGIEYRAVKDDENEEEDAEGPANRIKRKVRQAA